jgi:ABC-type sugar transport system ATPase subunit
VVARQTDVNELASLMVGREVRKTARDEQIVPKTRGSGIRVQSLSWQENGEPYTFEVGVGEILGITGPAGSGKSELLRTIMGFQPAVGGSVHLAGKRIRNPSPRSMIREGVAFIPEDRFAEGLFLPHSIEQNISLPNLWKSSRLLLKKSRLNRQAEDISAVVSLKKDTVLDPMTSLSGGNQQKVVIGKWLRFGYQYFLFDEPYKGIDIGAKEDINRVIEELARNGGSVIVASTEFSDILDLVHRLFVMVNRKIVAELCGEQISSQKIIQHYQAVVR